MKEKTRELIMGIAVIIALIYTGTALFIRAFSDNGNQNVTLNVVGIVNATNSSLVSFQLECIKFCGKDLAYSSNDKVAQCWEQCKELGK